MDSQEGISPTEIDQIDDLEFERRTLAAIRHELGLGGLARFLMTYRSGKGDYTAERHQWLANVPSKTSSANWQPRLTPSS